MPSKPAGQALGTSPLDRAAQRDVNVNGTSKISVDFKNMPRACAATPKPKACSRQLKSAGRPRSSRRKEGRASTTLASPNGGRGGEE
jgi:hypothetical protein